MNRITEQNLKKNEKQIISLYKKAYQEIYSVLVVGLDYSKNPNFSKVSLYKMKTQIDSILGELNVGLETVVPKAVMEAVEYGYSQSVLSYLEENGYGGKSLVEALEKFPFGAIAIGAAEQLALDTMKDLLAITNNTDKAVKDLIQKTFKEHLAVQVLLNRDYEYATQELLKHLTGSGLKLEIKNGIIAIVDKAGRRWKLDTYIDMAIQTKIQQAKVNGMKEFFKEFGKCDLAIIPKNGAIDECRIFEGLVISLTGETMGFQTYDDLKATNKIFHPRCRHLPSPIVDINSIHRYDREFHDILNSEIGDYLKK